jgi:protein ImuB
MFAAIYIHNFSLQSVLRHEPDLIGKPVVLTDPALTKPCITQLTSTARACGICAGMSPSQAMARCGNLVVKTRSLPQEQAAMETLMQTAYAFSPHIEATAPGVCTIELKGLSIRTNETSAKQWAAEILRVLKEFHLNGQIGFAETPALALLAAHAAKPVLVAQPGRARLAGPARVPHRAAGECPSPGTATPVESWGASTLHAHLNKETCCARGRALSDDFISTLPIEALDLPFESLEILKRWGINTVGAFLALGKGQLAERLGPAIIEVFDRLSTQSVRPLKIAAPPETFAEEIEFENAIETLEPLLFILRRFVEQLSRRIELLYFVIAELHLKLGLASGATYERAFTIPSPTGNAETLFRVLHTHLETVRTDAPIATLRLTAKPGRPESHQFGLFETTLRNPNQFAETLARLTALCGSDRVGTPVLEATYRPDAFQMKAADFRTSFERTFRTRTKTPSPCSSRRKEALTDLGSAQQRNMEPPYVGCYSLAECAPSPWGEGWGEGDSDLRRPKPQPRRDTRFRQPTVCGKQSPRGLPLRRFRPPLPARIESREHRPVLMRSAVFNGVIADIRGPFLSSGNWWENNRWWREEWDIQTADGNLYRIFRAAEEVGETVGRDCATRVALARVALAPLSLTPCFSGVYERPEASINCFNSLPINSGTPQRSGMSGTLSSQPDPAAPVAVSSQFERCVPPLPKGEGWGEGEGMVRQPTVDEAARHMRQPTVHRKGAEHVPLHRPGFEFFVEGVYD